MRFASPLFLRTAATYGLLIAAYALPSHRNPDYGEPGSLNADLALLDSRMAPMRLPGLGGKGSKDTTTPGGSGPPKKPGSGAPGGGGPPKHLTPAEPATGASGSDKTPNQRGREHINDMRTNFAKYAKDPKDVDRMPDFYDNIHDFDIVKDSTHHPGPRDYSVKPKEEKAPGALGGSPFSSTIDLTAGEMKISNAYRSGDQSIPYYGRMPMEKRPFISSYIADGVDWAKVHTSEPKQPVTKVTIENKFNKQSTNKLDEWSNGGRGDDFTIRETDKEDWEWVLGSELGSPLATATLKRPDVFEAHRPAEVRFFKGQGDPGQNRGMWQGEWKLVPGAPPGNI